MYVCNILCALYNIHATHGKSIFFSAYMVFLCSLQFGSLRIWSSREHMWDLSNKLGQLPRIPGILYGSTCSGFHMDLLVLFMAIWTYSLSVMVKSLFWGGTLHYTSLSLTVIVLHCWTKPPRPKGSAGAVCWLGVFSVRGGNNRQLQQHQVKVLFLLWKLGIHPSSLLLIYCYLLLWHLLSI